MVYFLWGNISGMFHITADNPTSEEVSFYFGGKEYTLAPYEKKEIFTIPFKTYLYTIQEETLPVISDWNAKYHFLNPTDSLYIMYSDIYCTNVNSYLCTPPRYDVSFVVDAD